MPRFVLLPVLALLLLPASARAQSIRGEVVDAASLQPLEGSVVVIMDSGGVAVATVIASAEGRFVAQLRQPGVYSLRVDRIGYESVTSQSFRLESEQEVFRRIGIPVRPVTLDAIEVSSGRACVVRPGAAAMATARVWEQARTALTAAATTQQQRLLRFDSESYTRELDGRSLRVRSEDRSLRRGTLTIPFGGRDALDLADNGYIQTVDNGRYFDFFAPTADVLLSDSFLDTHCFRLEEGEGENEGLIGLGFEPVRRREVPDIAGTLWIDRATSALRYAEMRYVSRDPRVPVEGALARVDFEALPGGRWIVDRWLIRMPLMVERRLPDAFAGSQTVSSIGSFLETGGEVTRITDASGNPILSAARYAAGGEVWDSLRGGPLALARVTLEGTARSAVTDSRGRFVLSDVPPGRYSVRVDHARLDSLPEAARPSGEIVVDEGGAADVHLAIPALYTVVEAACPGLWSAHPGARLPGSPYPVLGDALVTGIVRDEDGRPVRNAVAHVSWDAFDLTGTVIDVSRVIPSSTTDAEGRFTICGVPSDMPLSVWATAGEATSQVIEVRARGRFVHASPVIGG